MDQHPIHGGVRSISSCFMLCKKNRINSGLMGHYALAWSQPNLDHTNMLSQKWLFCLKVNTIALVMLWCGVLAVLPLVRILKMTMLCLSCAPIISRDILWPLCVVSMLCLRYDIMSGQQLDKLQISITSQRIQEGTDLTNYRQRNRE